MFSNEFQCKTVEKECSAQVGALEYLAGVPQKQRTRTVWLCFGVLITLCQFIKIKHQNLDNSYEEFIAYSAINVLNNSKLFLSKNKI